MASSWLSGKLGAIWRSLEVAENLHMGVSDRKFGPWLSWAARRPHHYYTTLGLACQYLNRKKIEQKKLLQLGQFNELTIECGTQTEIASQAQTSKKVFHSITSNYSSNSWGSKKQPSSQQLQQATSSRVSCIEWLHTSQLQHLSFSIIISFIIVFARGRPVGVCLARGETLTLVSPAQITFSAFHSSHPRSADTS